jgi:heme/copper-type cytochrome/quinol oxidase subunit 1
MTILAAYAFCPPAIAMQTNGMTWARVFAWSCFFLLVLFVSFVTLIGDGRLSLFSWQFSNKPV